jgi:hypothetical protein
MSEERWDHIYKKTLSDVLSQTETIALADKTSIGGGREMLEARNYQFVLEDPRDRILWNPTRALNVYGAIARFFWMLSGNDRLKDIAFYEPRVGLREATVQSGARTRSGNCASQTLAR